MVWVVVGTNSLAASGNQRWQDSWPSNLCLNPTARITQTKQISCATCIYQVKTLIFENPVHHWFTKVTQIVSHSNSTWSKLTEDYGSVQVRTLHIFKTCRNISEKAEIGNYITLWYSKAAKQDGHHQQRPKTDEANNTQCFKGTMTPPQFYKVFATRFNMVFNIFLQSHTFLIKPQDSTPRNQNQNTSTEAHGWKSHCYTWLHFFSTIVWRVRQTMMTTNLRAPFVLRLFPTYIPSAQCSALEDWLAGTTNDSSKVAAPCLSQCLSVMRCQPAIGTSPYWEWRVHVLPVICATFFFFRSSYFQFFGNHINGVDILFSLSYWMCALHDPQLWINLAQIVWMSHDYKTESERDWNRPILDRLFSGGKKKNFELQIVFWVVGLL